MSSLPFRLLSICMQLLFWVSFQLQAPHDVTEFGFLTAALDWCGTTDLIIVTLWYNSVIFQFSTIPLERSTWYTLIGNVSSLDAYIIGTKCTHTQPKLMIETKGVNALGVDKVKFVTQSGVWYGVNQIYIENERTSLVCFSTDPVNDCNHYPGYRMAKHIFHFDLTRPNVFIDDANWSDGSNVYPPSNICQSSDASINPTSSPLPAPTNPTAFPSVTPTNPMAFPSVTPTNPMAFPSVTPTNPTAFPSVTPTNPTAFPSVTPTHPTPSPSVTPTEFPTFYPSQTPIVPQKLPTLNAIDRPLATSLSRSTREVNVEITTTDTTLFKEASSDNLSPNTNSTLINIIAIVLASCVIILCVIGIIYLMSRLKKGQAKSVNDIQKIHARYPEVHNGKEAGASAPVEDSQIEEDGDSDSEGLYGAGPTDTGGQTHAHGIDMKVEGTEARTEEDEQAIPETALRAVQMRTYD
eukprot:827632_1